MSQTQSNPDDLIFIFGSQDLSFDKVFAKTLRATLLDSSDSQWIVQSLLELPQHWKSLEEAIPSLRDSDGEKHLHTLVDWLRLGELPDEVFPLPNVLLTPMVVVTQLTQYSSLVNQLYPDITADDQLPYLGNRRTETIGLCTGLFSAAAVASSRSLRDLSSHGAVAIRLAMASGAVVDAGEHQTASGEDDWQSFAVAWNSLDAREKFMRAMDDCDEVGYLILDKGRTLICSNRRIYLSSPVKDRQQSQFEQEVQSHFLAKFERLVSRWLKLRYVGHSTWNTVWNVPKLLSTLSTQMRNSSSPGLPPYHVRLSMPKEGSTSMARACTVQ